MGELKNVRDVVKDNAYFGFYHLISQGNNSRGIRSFLFVQLQAQNIYGMAAKITTIKGVHK